MSVTIETLVSCDSGAAGKDCYECNSGDARHATAAEQRRSLKRDGWRQVGSKDYCPACLEVLGESLKSTANIPK